MSDELDSFPPMHPNIQGIGRERARKAQQGAESVQPHLTPSIPSAQPDTDPDLLAASRFAKDVGSPNKFLPWLTSQTRLLMIIGASVVVIIVSIGAYLLVRQHPDGRQVTTIPHSMTKTPTDHPTVVASVPTQNATPTPTPPISATPSPQTQATLVPPISTHTPVPPTPTITPIPPTPTPVPPTPTPVPTFTSNPPNPQAYMITKGGSNVTGWACDSANGDRTSQVDFYANARFGQAGSLYLGGVRASDNSPDLVTAGVCGRTPNHGFFFNAIGAGTGQHTIWAYNNVNGTVTVVDNSGNFTISN